MPATRRVGSAGDARRSARSSEPAPGPDAAPQSGDRSHRGGLPAELALFVVGVTTVIGFDRLFAGRSFVAPLLLAATGSHVVAAALRRRRVALGPAVVISLGLMVFVLALLLHDRWGLPDAETWARLRSDLDDAVAVMRRDTAPVDAVRGLVALAAIATWVSAFVGDWAAFRLMLAVEAVLPYGALFVVGSVLGTDGARTRWAGAYFVVVVLFVLLHRSARLEAAPNWATGDAGRGARAQLRTGVTLIAGALLAGALLGPLLPGARSGPFLDVKTFGGQSSRVALSPLVDVRRRLVDQSDTVAFTVRADRRSYWRLTALDAFDGRVWSSSSDYTTTQGPATLDAVPPGAVLVEQDVTVAALDQIWLPAAYQPVSVGATDRQVQWAARTSTLVVREGTAEDVRYSVTSAVLSLDADRLRAATAPPPRTVAQTATSLPGDFPASVRALAQRLTAGAATPYDAALALQDYFRTNYTYSLDAPGGESIEDISDFLFSPVRAGYCEQFAGSFAAMARSIGLPARVAVGFTPGEADPDEPDRYIVRGRHAHAWPEVYLGGVGWVLFEPTPGRGAPDTAYTNTTESQDDRSGEASPGSTTTTAAGPTTSTVDTPGVDPLTEPAPGSVDTAPGASAGSGPGRLIGVGFLVAVAVSAFTVAFTPLGRRLLRRRRVRRAVHAGRLVELAWQDAVVALAMLGVHPRPEETPSEFAARAQRRFGDDDRAPVRLAALVTAARFGPVVAARDLVLEAQREATVVERQVRARAGRRAQWWAGRLPVDAWRRYRSEHSTPRQG